MWHYGVDLIRRHGPLPPHYAPMWIDQACREAALTPSTGGNVTTTTGPVYDGASLPPSSPALSCIRTSLYDGSDKVTIILMWKE